MYRFIQKNCNQRDLFLSFGTGIETQISSFARESKKDIISTALVSSRVLLSSSPFVRVRLGVPFIAQSVLFSPLRVNGAECENISLTVSFDSLLSDANI